ncbi:MAG: GFA family protein [Deltaproteobacteria bacterium]|nr:GFA family protein [Deltaproteobacteria bacterium]MBW2395533.1 GFA family protein [Deltaproteobacteria bacterium]
MTNASMTGRCLCGDITFTAREVETEIHACHCSMCRTWSGGPVLGAAVASVEYSGEENIAVYGSSEWAERGFCKTCGTNLFYRFKESGQHVLWSGTFDDPAAFRLVGEIYIDEKPAGYAFAGDHIRQTGAEFMASLSNE